MSGIMSSTVNLPSLVIGASGGIGAAFCAALARQQGADQVIGLSRHSDPAIDLTDEASIAAAAASVAGRGPFGLIVVATGALNIAGRGPEKRLGEIDAAVMAQSFAINTIGPALIAKHFFPLLPRDMPCAFAALSARVGSIGDNALGGWYSYRAAKAGLNQILRTAAVELARTRPLASVVALHPGTVRTLLSRNFTKPDQGFSPDEAVARMLATLADVAPGFCYVDYDGKPVPY